MMSTVSDAIFYLDGLCNFCGTKGRFSGEIRRAREQFACQACGATLRYRSQAAAMLAYFADGSEVFLDKFMRSEKFSNISILECAIRGPFSRRFRSLKNYTQCYLFEGVPLGAEHNGVSCQNLEKLTFADATFDLVLSSDVMEHVANPRQAIAEISRVLCPGGAHVFSVPVYWPISQKSTVRARIVDGRVENLAEPHFHRSGQDEPSLVFTDFGADLLDWHSAVGMDAVFHDSHRIIDGLGRFPTVVAVKLPSGD